MSDPLDTGWLNSQFQIFQFPLLGEERGLGEGSKVFGVRFPVLSVFDFKSVNIFERLNEYLERIPNSLEVKKGPIGSLNFVAWIRGSQESSKRREFPELKSQQLASLLIGPLSYIFSSGSYSKNCLNH